jgi:hypothetical protein
MAGLFDDVLGAQPAGSAGLFDDVLKPAPAPKDRTWGEAASDTGIGLVKGAVGLAKLVPMAVGAVDSFVSDAFNLGEPASGGAFNNIGTKALNRAEDYLQSKKSAAIQAKEQAQEQDALAFGDKFKNDGTIARVAAEFGYKFANSFTDPALLLQGVSENVATMLPAGAVARGTQIAATKVAPRIAAELSKEAVEVAARRLGTAAGVTTGAVQQGADVASEAYDQMMKMDDSVWQRREDYVKLAQQIGADKAKNQIAGQLATEAGVRGGLASLVVNGLGAKFGGATLESAFLKRGASEATEAGLKGALKSGAKDALGETVTESLEEGYGAYAKNVAAQQVDENIDPYRGVGSAAGSGGALGAVMGGGVGALHGYAGERPAAPPAPAINPADAALNQAVDRFDAARSAYLDPAVASDAVTSAPSIEEAINTANAITSGGTNSLAQAVGERAKGAQLVTAMDRQAELAAQANAAPTAFDRQSAQDQAQVALESLRPAAQPASNVVEDSFANEMQATQRLAVLRDEAAQAGQDPASLTVQPSPAAEGRFQIVSAPEQTAEAAPTPAPAPAAMPVASVEQRLNAAADAGMAQAYLRQRDILDRGQVLGSQLSEELLPGDQQAFKQAYENVANRGGVASPKEAAVLDRMSPNERLYDQVEGRPPALKAAELPTVLPTAQQQGVNAAQSEGIARRMGLTDNTDVPGTVEAPSLIVPEQRAPARERQPVPQMQAEITNTLRENANDASMAQLEQQAQQKQAQQNAAIEAATPPAQQTAPEANRVIDAFRKIPALRTAEDKAVVDSAMRTYSPEDIRILRDTAEAPFRLSTTDRIRLGELRQSTAGIKTSEQRSAEAVEAAPAEFTVADTRPTDLKTLPQQSQANRGELSQQSHRFLKSLASVFGKKLVVFESNHPQAVDGYVVNGSPNTIYLNRNSQKSHLVVFGHELMHLLKMTEPGAYTAIRNAVKLRAEEQGRFDTTQGIRGDFEELISDLQGDLFADTGFWVDVFREVAAKQNDKAVIRLGATLVRAVDRFIKALKSVATFDSAAMVANMSEVRSAIQTALATYATNQKAEAQALYQEEQNAANQEPQQAGVQGERQAGDQVGAPAEAGVGNRVLGDEEIPAPESQGRQGVVPPTKAQMAARRARQEMGMRFSEQRNGRIDNVEAYHFSKAPRKILSSNAYGSNYAGSGKDQYLRAKDERRRQRVYFYFDKGTGIRSEAGVGGYAHKAALNNVYDINKDPLKLRVGTQEQTETNVLDAGFAGYLDRMEGNQSGQIIMLGKQDIPVQPLPLGTKVQAGVQVEPVAAPAKAKWEDRLQGSNRDLLVRKMSDMQAKPDWAGYDMQIVDAGRGFFSLQVKPKGTTNEQQATPAATANGLSGRGNVSGSNELLANAYRANQGTDLQNLPGAISVPGLGSVKFHSFAPAQQAAQRYMESRGLQYQPPRDYAKVDPERAKRIAAAFDEMAHTPDDPEVLQSYNAMIDETLAQYRAILATGLKVEFIDYATQGDPYAASPRLAIADVVTNNHLWVFSTRDGFGSSNFDPRDNPLLRETEFEISGQKTLANDIFRVVHDYFGHIKEGVGFRADGEENAWRAHASMYSPLARRAMTTETRGQNSWVNYGPFGEANRTAGGAETRFADQKIGLLPEWVSEDGRTDVKFSEKREQLNPEIVAALGKHIKSLTPQERAKLRRDTAQKFVNLIESMPSAKEMAATAYAGRAKRGWYNNSARAIEHVFGGDAPRFAGLLSALSPQCSVETNLLNALNTWKNWTAAGRPTTREEIVEVMGRSVQGDKGVDSVLDAWINNSVRVLSAEDPSSVTLSGPKVNSFMLNLRGFVDEVTNDAWMANYALVDQKLFAGSLNAAGNEPGKGPGYLAMSARVREAARTLTRLTGEQWTPAEVQETVWSWAKTLYEKADAAEESRSAVDLVRDRALTDDLINSTPDFRTLFNDEVNESILRDAGLGERVESLRSRSDLGGAEPEVTGAQSKAAPFAADAQLQYETRAAKRLDKLRQQRRDQSAVGIRASAKRDQTETPEFKRWFGNSKVVDTEGKPLVVYHGSRADIGEFVPSRGGEYGSGIYFSPDEGAAWGYAERAAGEGGENITPVYLSLKNPFYATERETVRSMGVKRLQAKGYDGIIATGPTGERQYIAFNPAQIKSAIGNNGEFDPSNPDIRYSEKRSPLGFYSALATNVDQIKTNAAPAQGWKDAIKGLVNKGAVKADEVEWSGVNDWLDLQKGKVTKEQLAEYLKQGGVQVEETVLGRDGKPNNDEWEPDDGLVGNTRYGRYTLPGGENYREVLITLPENVGKDGEPLSVDQEIARLERMIEVSREIATDAVAEGQDALAARMNAKILRAQESIDQLRPIPPSQRVRTYRSAHWDQANILAHLRLNDRTDADGKRVLFVEEIQSDWGQEGKKKGFGSGRAQYQVEDANGRLIGKFDNREEADALAAKTRYGKVQKLMLEVGVPNAPFVTKTEGWLNLALKRVIAMAAEGGYDRVAFTTGAQNADRYDLSKQIDSVLWERMGGDKYQIIAYGKDQQRLFNQYKKASELPDVVGKELADKIVNAPPEKKRGSFIGLELQVGGEGMRTFYDQIVPQAVKKLLPKVGGGQMQAVDIGGASTQPGFDVTPAMQEKVAEGLPLFSRKRIVGDSSRPYTPEQKAMFQNVGRTVEVPTLKERIASLRKDFGKRVTQGVVDQFAPIKELTQDGYLLARLSKGAAGAVEAFMQHGKLSLNGGVYDADRSGGVLDRVFAPLQGEAEDFLWWVAGNRAERLSKEDRENLFTAKDIAAAKSLDNGTTGFDYTLQNGPNAGRVTRDRTLIYRDVLKTFDEFNKNAMDMAEQSGLINKESRQYWEHEFYVPFYRVSEDTGGFVGGNIGKGLVRQQAFKQLKGGTDKLNSDLLANTLQNWSHLIDAAAKNRAAKATLEAAANMGVAVEAPQSTIQQMGKAGGKAVWFMDEGVQRHFLVEDPYLLDAINGLQFAGLRGPIMDALSGFKHWLTVGVTASPFFKIRNLIRDSMQAIAVSPLSYNPATNFRQGLAASNRESQTYVSSLASGGLIRFGTMLEGNASERVRQLVRMGVDQSTILNSPDKIQAVMDKFRKGFMAYSEIGNRGEEINRAALYDQLVKNGVSHAEAALMARDLMDFSMQGSWASVRFLTQVVPFMNARLQGLYKLGKAANEDKARFAAVLGAVGAFSLMLMAVYHDDDDWKKREDWDRNNNWWFKIGGVAYRIPKPFEIGAMATLAERGVELFTSDEMTKQRFLKQVLTLAGDSLSMNPIPQAVKPVMDIYANKDSFTGRPIETMGMDRLAPDYRFNSRTSMVARGLGTAGQSALNAAGLNKLGVEFLSPVQIDHLIQGYFSWLGAFAVGGADMLVRPLTNEPTRPAADMFKLASGGMVAQVDSASSRYVSNVYEQAKVLEQAYGTWRSLIKQNKLDEAREYFAENKDQIARYRMVEKVKSGEAKFNEMIRMIERSSLDPDAKRERINLIRAQQDRMARVLAPQ